MISNTIDVFSVSVIIPTHNRLASLKRAVASVADQRHRVLEVIVVNDGSTDDTALWLSQQPPIVRHINQSNHGVSHARNRGIEIARGNWIAFLDSDDYWHHNKLDVQCQALAEDSDKRFCHCDEIWIRNGRRVNPKIKHRKRGGHIFEHCLPLCVISPSAALMHRSLLDKYGHFDESLPACEDYDLWLRITAHESVCYVDEKLLTKTGGHEDQLSRRYLIMDTYRIHALAKLLNCGTLPADYQALCEQTLRSKLNIVMKGAHKHANDKLLHQLNKLYSQWIDAPPDKP